MADMNKILTTLRDAIARDPDVTAWCELTYHQTHHVFVGLDANDPPKSTDYPAVLIHPVHKDQGDEAGELIHRFGLECGVYDEAKETLPDTNVTEILGIQRSESMRKLVETAAVKAAEAMGYRVTSAPVEYASVDVYPYFLTSEELTISQPTEMGMDMFD